MTLRMLPLRSAFVVGATGAALAAAPGASAAAPRPNARIEVHDHATVGRNWHVQAEVSSTSRSVRLLVLYVEQCRQTVFAKNVVVSSPDGSFTTEGAIGESAGKGPGTWRVSGRFVEPTHLEGTYEMVSGDCATGVQPFHGHTGAHHHAGSGTPLGQYPDPSTAPAQQLREADGLWRGTLASARTTRLRGYSSARRVNYRPISRDWKRPLIFHLRNEGYERDRRVLDPRRPESLVYWWPASGPPVLLAFMYRAPTSQTPTLAGALLGWHAHASASGAPGATQMSHVWLTRNLRTGLANCLPVQALEAAIPRFRYSNPATGSGPESWPCPTP